jgi:hypothetical protein
MKNKPQKPTHTLDGIKQLPDATSGLCYVAIGAFCWGKDKNAAKAIKHARSNGSSGIYILHLVNEGAEINSVDGTLWYNSKLEGIKLSLATIKVR